VRRLLSSQRSLARIVRADVAERERHHVDTSDAQVTVVDLHNLDDRAKRFVVGVTIKRAFDRKEQSGQARPLLFLVLDELNKYAPREGTSPIKEILLDVAERGRSLGVILVGAQQTASEVERRIIANSALRVTGRLDPAEAQRGEYGFLPAVHRDRAVIAKPGTMFVSQPEIPVPLVAEFPFPAWATRPSERGDNPAATGLAAQPDDPFAGFPG
jgi:DNA helicase HerA-like ATPase